MARSGAKQGNRKNRVRVKNADGSLKRDARGRIVTVGLLSRPLASDWRAKARANARSQYFAAIRAEKAAKLARETAILEMQARVFNR